MTRGYAKVSVSSGSGVVAYASLVDNGTSDPTTVPILQADSASCVGPSIISQPQSQTVSTGQTASLSVASSGAQPLAYQWFTGSSGVTSHPIAGATSVSYTTPPLTATAGYWVRVSNPCGHADSVTATITVTGGASPAGIHGRVTYQGLPLGGITLSLLLLDKTTFAWSTVASTISQTDGSYEFNGLASLGSGKYYWLMYQNGQPSNPNYLATCFSPYVTSYTSGMAVQVRDLDITNIALTSPGPGVTSALPQTFSWQRRSTSPTDSYFVEMFDPSNQDTHVDLGPLGYVSTYTLSSLPSGFTYGTTYGWYVLFAAPDGGGGTSYYYNPITFSSR
jgi:Ig-like domain CHU_C associated